MNPHQYEESLAEKSLKVAGVAGITTILSLVCFIFLFVMRHENPQGWSKAWEPAVFGGVSLIVTILGFLVWALDSYGYFDNFFDFTGERKEPPNPFC